MICSLPGAREVFSQAPRQHQRSRLEYPTKNYTTGYKIQTAKPTCFQGKIRLCTDRKEMSGEKGWRGRVVAA